MKSQRSTLLRSPQSQSSTTMRWELSLPLTPDEATVGRNLFEILVANYGNWNAVKAVRCRRFSIADDLGGVKIPIARETRSHRWRSVVTNRIAMGEKLWLVKCALQRCHTPSALLNPNLSESVGNHEDPGKELWPVKKAKIATREVWSTLLHGTYIAATVGKNKPEAEAAEGLMMTFLSLKLFEEQYREKPRLGPEKCDDETILSLRSPLALTGRRPT
ncbi:hypothetical protein BZA05DRAFT_421631 [Tricharina praecox]|uniref:uncharacterized protein n=1 Tax=Tricharina praecox TaxID=43433 RepID=UPI00221FF045|nr:uncharacterized protein BZA05DRAFT_421631 [Tricharina praecox]KAI5844697.1 hypothetical protein BZA05DRAFT_421631 [Tricharina praecox]